MQTVSEASSSIRTPAFVYDEELLLHSIEAIRSTLQSGSGSLLFATKAFCIASALEFMTGWVDGFATSSLFEAKLARNILRNEGSVHITTPALHVDEIDQISALCDFVSLNSLSQWELFGDRLKGKVSCGLRVNPQLSFVQDERYSPCRRHSKLGVPLDTLLTVIENDPPKLKGIEGILIHSNCDSSAPEELLATVKLIADKLGEMLPHLRWVNVGGGYLFSEAAPSSTTSFQESIGLLRKRYGVDVFVEPGAAIARNAGYLVSSVLDVFDSQGKSIVILDTSVNHMPEVFEYQFEPDVLGHRDGAPFQYVLAGSTCLAGDVFGEYAFESPLKIGDRVVFEDMGAYTFVKAHMFNGINLPSIYARTVTGAVVLKKHFTFEDFETRCGVKSACDCTSKSLRFKRQITAGI